MVIRILLVEDDPQISRSFTRLIKRDYTAEVVAVDTAEAAIALLAVERFTAIVSDFNLRGEGNGADVLAHAGGTPFLFVTSDDAATGFGVPRLEKPCRPSELRDAISELLTKAAA